ncbi:MAG: 16S rRNA (adenine(1518)-N(6)/adenine(1519)-N(6))-dimethyltransferase RsmA [Snodgrassella sp.]|uniref:16S rRNA (adenine(1518)-N(6)/adenine(1519)-N(6))- dimethyltransferase RsmA n=1 Tax=Snodgrassella TaxID=1193515 RepID=UPI000815B5DB|nr:MULTISPECIES: 16S rRNA (adenine(1518)-N(6)/adenine(1519)-N(6))-dimethyltransferase RsmA [Snodgrassella]MCO6514213.1 16S rRNA (adenine(1518)-N(6)/adenine(1519)-N(6))-dimethyltransferase RsmA [Snodgrassella sp.]MCO6520924.1 16S rRNA (adenine(1518)-N(6)/adenine(1519)-N(6))-dimethyltransferase RsmA [Snodgrassella sp.]MCO6523257.1 16S rRNA (adenine(1518)-N(6)/adenine(1519)-N(6))-dimethyltransferase RsmA [Snodgrassella sp.]SCC20082.1 16S rRNA (adenine1518-N6/adenine1519-N6)-dimethyltransferase [Sn
MKEHRARKRFGQNFLQDKSIIQDIVRAVRPQPEDTVLEIGPGLAAITAPLAAMVDRLHVIEIDRDIVARLRTLPFASKLVIHEGDVLQFDFASVPGRKKIVGNLPYNISTPLLFRFGKYADDIVDMHFMLQKEVVERMVAVAGSNDYGRLSVMLQYFFEMESLLDVPPQAFNPAPKVDSAVVRMIPQHGRIGIAQDFAHFAALVKQAFQQRRKTIHNNLKEWVDDAALMAVGIDPGCRPERIPPELYVGLSNYLLQNGASVWIG